MFCSKCGTNVADDAAFCPTCGNQFNAAPAPAVAPSSLAIGGLIKIPSIPQLISIALSVLVLIFSFLPTVAYKISYGGESQGESYGLFTEEIGSIIDSADNHMPFFLVMARIFCIIGIVAFVLYVASLIIDFATLVPALPAYLNKIIAIAYSAVMILFIICLFIGSLYSETSLGAKVAFFPAVCWYFELIFIALNSVIIFVPDVFKKIGLNF